MRPPDQMRFASAAREIRDTRFRLPVVLAGETPPGIYRLRAAPCGIPGRDRPKPAVDCACAENRRARFAGILGGNDGTRTRDLRRDRPVLVSPG
jgi:hypothetical protein